MTDGILIRMLQSDPGLQGVGAVVFDEFHERNLDRWVKAASDGGRVRWQFSSSIPRDESSVGRGAPSYALCPGPARGKFRRPSGVPLPLPPCLRICSDLALALCLDSQQLARPDLRLVVMSATLGGGLAEMLASAMRSGGDRGDGEKGPDVPIVVSEGRSYPVGE